MVARLGPGRYRSSGLAPSHSRDEWSRDLDPVATARRVWRRLTRGMNGRATWIRSLPLVGSGAVSLEG